MKRKTAISILVVIIVLLACGGYLKIRSVKQEGTRIYQFDVNADDLIMRDFEIVACNDCTYFTDKLYFEKITNRNVRDIFVTLEYNKEAIHDWVFQFDHLTIQEQEDTFLTNLVIKPEDDLTVKIKYTVDGKEYEFYELLDLEKGLKYKS